MENNVFVEFGRFSPEGLLLEPGSILLSSKRAGEPLNVLVGNECRFIGEVVAVEENFGVRIISASNIIKYDEEHYLALRLGACYHDQEELAKIQEGTVLDLDSLAGDPISIIQDGKTVARGEVVIVDDFYGVRICD
ncbi:MAG: FliM/FliN family flagellar motor switch protein [Treponema sp.]|nr:FliM/FliN family flagellar motor switch protein [Treponema sp.]